MKVAILGFDVEGRASYEYFKAQGCDITICDQNTAITVPEGVEATLGEQYLDDLDRFDLLIRTPGLKPATILEKNPDVAPKISSATNEFLNACPTRNVIGITGTKGKGTTSTLITKILQAAGKKVFLGGNIGVPPLSFLSEITPDDWIVLELSSFQLIDLRYSPHIAVCLMIIPEHLNWHHDLEEYVNAKRQLVVHQTGDDLTVYNAGNHFSIDIAQSSRAHKLWYQVTDDDMAAGEAPREGAYVRDNTLYFGETAICTVDEVGLLGRHNLQNICAAIAATWEVIDRNVDAIRSVITTFRGLEHRLELVRSLNGVAYYDDSFGTTPETAAVALKAFHEPKVVIMGGSDKGTSFDELAETVMNANVKHIVLIGNTAHPEHPSASPRLAEVLQAHGFQAISSLVGDSSASMVQAVQTAQAIAQPGDVVLLAPACASFDMFENYKDRAAQFQQAVNALA